MIDIPALQALLEKAMHQPPWCLHDDRMGKGIGARTTKYDIGGMEFDDDERLAVAAVNALPALLAIAEAALKLRDQTWINAAGIHAKESQMYAFVAAVDEARKTS